jgi:hypothetical protein
MGLGDNTCNVVLGGHKRELFYGTRAICFIERASGQSFSEAATRGGVSFLVLATAAGLSHLPEFRRRFEPKPGEFDLSLVEDWFDQMPKEDEAAQGAPDTLRTLGAKIAVALRGGMPGVRPAADERPDDVRPTSRPAPSTGGA